MWRALSAALILGVGLLTAAAEQARDRPERCLDLNAEVMRFSEINETIHACTAIITNESKIPRMRTDALAQRGLLYARRWTFTDDRRDAFRSISDLSDALGLADFASEGKRIILLMRRGQVYEVLGQRPQAADDFRAVLMISPRHEAAQSALKRLGESP